MQIHNEGLETRPTTDRIKETLFNMLQPYLPGGIFIDLFSGTFIFDGLSIRRPCIVNSLQAVAITEFHAADTNSALLFLRNFVNCKPEKITVLRL